MKRTIRLLSILSALVIVSVAAQAQYKNGFEVSRMDRECKPCDDFYRFVNGNWLKSATIPEDKARYGSFDILAENNRKVLLAVLTEAAASKNAKTGSDEYKIGAMFATCMDEASIEKGGAKPIQPLLDRIARINSRASLISEITYLHGYGIPALFGFGAAPDLKNSSINIANLNQGGLSLPNRDYYVKTDPKSVETRTAFVKHMTRMFVLLGDTEAAATANAQAVMDIQMKLAEASLSSVELRNPNNRYNRKTIAELESMVPEFDWKAYLTARNAAQIADLNVGQPKFFQGLNGLLKSVSINDWKNYLRWQVVHTTADELPSAFVKENFEFYGKTLSGQKEMQPRAQRCTQVVDRSLGEILGKFYVAKTFPPESRRRMNAMIDNLVAAFRDRIGQLEWMSEPTKQQALAKLAAFSRKIGYPEKWKDYSAVTIMRKSYFENVFNLRQFNVKDNVNRIGKPVDKSLWGMTPPTVNAYYQAANNEVVFPAGILQPPFFNKDADDAINYGGIGAVIGHELSHGFDDSGSQFDAQGNLRMWWTAEDRKKFDARTDCVVQQFNSYKVTDGLYQNGKLVLGESIGDLGGITMAYYAFKKSIEGKSRPANIDGFTPEQRFFIGWAQVWAQVSRPEQERAQTLGDPHPLGRFRVNGPLSNFSPFADAWGCHKGDNMIREGEKKCEIW